LFESGAIMTTRLTLGASLCVAAAFWCAACSTTPAVKPTATISSSDDAYFVMGISPPVTVRVVSGNVNNGVFRKSEAYLFAPFVGAPIDGFIVGKAHHGNEVMGLSAFFTGPYGAYGACSGENVIVFTSKPGKVVYITNVMITYETEHTFPQNNRLFWKQSPDYQAALAYMKTHYPQLAEKFEPAEFQIMPGYGDCS
jgi:hypothetical protein